jgi:hypothetical protein
MREIVSERRDEGPDEYGNVCVRGLHVNWIEDVILAAEMQLAALEHLKKTND